jgi:hypothetical protein
VQEIGSNEASVQVTYRRGSRQPNFGITAPLQRVLHREKKEAGLGIIEYIPSTRIFQEGQVNLQNVDPNYQHSLDRSISDSRDKYHDAKQKYVNFLVHDNLCPNDPPIFPKSKVLLKRFLNERHRLNLMAPH